MLLPGGHEPQILLEAYDAGCDLHVAIAMRALADSLNAAVTGAVLACEASVALKLKVSHGGAEKEKDCTVAEA